MAARGYWFQPVEVLGVVPKPASPEGLLETSNKAGGVGAVLGMRVAGTAAGLCAALLSAEPQLAHLLLRPLRPRPNAQVLSERLGLLYPVLLLGQSLLIAAGCLGVMCLGLRRCAVRRLAYRPLTTSAVV